MDIICAPDANYKRESAITVKILTFRFFGPKSLYFSGNFNKKRKKRLPRQVGSDTILCRRPGATPPAGPAVKFFVPGGNLFSAPASNATARIPVAKTFEFQKGV